MNAIPTTNWTVAVNNGNEVVKHYPFNEQGYMTASSHATQRGYEVWQSFDGEPRYLMQRPREK